MLRVEEVGLTTQHLNHKPISMYTYPFEKLEVWQLSKKIVVKIYKITGSFHLRKNSGLSVRSEMQPVQSPQILPRDQVVAQKKIKKFSFMT